MAPATKRLEQIENRLRGNLTAWRSQTLDVLNVLQNTKPPATPYGDPNLVAAHAKMLHRITDEMVQAESDLSIIDADLRAAKADAEYREVLVRSWPVNHFLDRLTYIGTAILGAGGAAFVLVGLDLAIFFWAVGLILMATGLGGLWEWERKKWDFYADQFSVDDRYRPWRREPATNLPLGVATPQVAAETTRVRRRTRAAASVIVIAAAFVWAAGYAGERAFGTDVGFWLYWEAIIFFAFWTLEHSWSLVLGKTKHTIQMFGGRVLVLMFLASVLFIFVGPTILVLTLNPILGAGIMLVGVALWVAAAADWAQHALKVDRQHVFS